MRLPKFHVFDRWAPAWPDVCPGDVVISPSTPTYRMEDFMDRNETQKDHCVIVQKNPLLVLTRIDGIIGGPSPDPFNVDYATYVLFSITKGFLCVVMKKEATNGRLGT